MTYLRHLAVATGAAALLAAAPSSNVEPLAPVRLNQLGLLPDGQKIAVLPHASPNPLPWRLLAPSDRAVSSGRTTVIGQDEPSGEHLHRIDFSTFRRAGQGYRLVVGGAASRPFAIAKDVYSRLPFDAFAYFYHNRAGTPIEERFVGRQWARPAGHSAERATCVSGADSQGNSWPGCDYTLDVTGGWYDAGDHGKYVVNGGISLWTLLNAYEQGAGRKTLADGKAAIPEAGNGASDLLDEARWEMEFLLKMQAPAGARADVPIGVKRTVPAMRFTPIDASGLAHHKVADVRWTALPTAPHEDKEKRQLFPVTTGATLNLAATAAQCARIWRDVDDAFAARCRNAAEAAWAAALRNPEIYALADFTGSGGYGDNDLSDEFYWAAAELFVSTGQDEYLKVLRQSPHHAATVAAELGWNRVASLGTITLATIPSRLPAADRKARRAALRAAADAYLADSAKVGYHLPYAPAGWPWGSTSSILNRAMILATAFELTGERRYRNGVIDAMDFILGRNPLDQSFVSGYGARPMRNPHHRFWAHQLDARYPPPPPGALSGGPNNTAFSDPIAAPLKGKCAAQTCWRDDARSFAMNEVAINWNAPLVWVSSWLRQN